MSDKKDYKALEIDWILIILIALVFILGWLTSCNTVHKLYNKHRTQTDSTHSTTIITNTDSSNSSSKTVTIDSSKHNFINIVFNSDTQHINTPIYVKVDSNGTYIINAGFRTVKTITINQKQNNNSKLDSIGLVAVRGQKQYHDTTQLSKSETVIDKSKISHRFPIGIVAGGVAFICLIAVGWYMQRKLNFNI